MSDDTDCALGSFVIVTVTSAKGIPDLGVTTLTGTGGSTHLDMTQGQWELTDDAASPMTITATIGSVVVPGTLTVKGTSSGLFVRSGDTYRFTQDDATGSATVAAGPLSQRLDMAVIGPAIAPSGAASITCTPDGLTITSESGQLGLDRVDISTSDDSTAPTSTTIR